MPQSEKLKLKAEILTGEREVENPQLADQKTLAKQIYEAYLKNFSMNKAKARTILTGKTNRPVRLDTFLLLYVLSVAFFSLCLFYYYSNYSCLVPDNLWPIYPLSQVVFLFASTNDICKLNIVGSVSIIHKQM